MTPDLTNLTRYRDRRIEGRAELNALLDQVLIGTLATVVDGEPWVIPTLFARDADSVVFHGSTGAGLLRYAESGAPFVFSVHALDALKLAPSMFNTGARYRSAVIRGQLSRVEGSAARSALDVFNDRVVPGRAAEVRGMSARELAATTVLSLPISEDNWILKAAAGEPAPDDESNGAWCGTITMGATAGELLPASWQDPALTPTPAAVGFANAINEGRLRP